MEYFYPDGNRLIQVYSVLALLIAFQSMKMMGIMCYGLWGHQVFDLF